MLKHLYIQNFVLIDEIDLDFAEDFSVFVGETGAGKSIMIDAIGILCGDRASVSLISKDADKAVIEGTFDLSGDVHAIDVMNEAGLDIHDETTFTKEILANGKSVSRIDHRIVTAGLMKNILENQVDIHGQRDNAYLLNTGTHIQLLDQYLKTQNLVEKVSSCFAVYDDLLKEKAHALEDVYNENDIEFFSYQIQEINDADLVIGEDEELLEKEKHYKTMKDSMDRLFRIASLYEDSVSSPLYELNHEILSLHGDSEMESIQNDVNDAYYQISDAMERLQRQIASFDLSEEEINEMEERLFLIQKLKRKYGRTIEAILEKRDTLQKQIEQITHKQEYLERIDQKIKKAYEKYSAAAEELSQIRRTQCTSLDMQIAEILKDLKLPNAKFHTEITEGKPSALGNDKVEFMIAMNKGDSYQSLAKTASGGELSRLMLGLKVIFTALKGIQTVIFDEIDTGVSGPVATAIGRKMKELSNNCQVFSVTHLAQVAACADHMYFVSKTDDETKTRSRIELLDENRTVEQLAFIASGEITPAAIDAARELYQRNHKL